MKLLFFLCSYVFLSYADIAHPSTFSPVYTNLAIADTDPKVLTFNGNSLSVITAESRVSVVVIPPKNSTNYHFLRGVMFYDGPDWNSTYLGSAMQFWKSENQMVSTGNTLTVQYLTLLNSVDGYVVLQEYEKTKMIASYQGVACGLSMNICGVELDNLSGPSAMVTYVPDGLFYFGETVTGMGGTGTLDVYIGGVTKNQKNLIKSYTNDDSESGFPQRINGNIRTYVLRGNKTDMAMIFNQRENDPLPETIGKKGFISSNHYLQNGKSQEVHENIRVNQLATFSFAIDTADLSSNATCSIKIYNNKDVVYSYDNTNLPSLSNVVQVIGDSLTVDFSSNGNINVPQGWFATFYLIVNTTGLSDGSAPVQIIDQMGRTEDVFSIREWVYFIAEYGKIKISTGKAKVKIGFDVQWMPYPSMESNIVKVKENDTRPVVFSRYVAVAVRISADTQVSATIIPPRYESDIQYLRGVMFFDGESGNATCLGTGLQLLNGETQFVSSGKYMTIIYLRIPFAYNYVQYVFQDYESIKDIVQFQGKQFVNWYDSAMFSLNASNGPVALQTLLNGQNFEVVTRLEGAGILDVYQGRITKNGTNLITSYYAENCERYLPQIFFGTPKTYVLRSGHATLNISGGEYENFAPTNSFGRQGIIASGDYGTMSKLQDISVEIDGVLNKSSVFRYYIQSADLIPGVKLEIQTKQDGNRYTTTYDSSNLPYFNLFNELPGKSFYITYRSNGNTNKGFLLNFEIVKSSVATKLFGVIMLTIMNIFASH
ncbi:hypothetical protein CAEBREN_09422 [Caenorhabditis brenneri]|uniref:Uncharacterized protein n=1 Tax=Caenorhabditis brenneri TaxID=135651 RepID=G0NMS5_CAEBE|nr:hypothetical protein CAEBREN_09422 [Caenorhabditis brenneri]